MASAKTVLVGVSVVSENQKKNKIKLILSPKLSGYYQLCLLPRQETALVCQKERNHECCELLIDNVAF